MLTDEQLADLLRFEFHAGPEPDASSVIDAVTREISDIPFRSGLRRRAAALCDEGASTGIRRSTSSLRWRLALPAGAVVATTSILAGLGVFSSGPAALSVETVAYWTTSAVTTASTSEIAYVRAVVTDPSGTSSGAYDWWSRGGNGRVEQVGADGSPLTDTSWSNANGVVSGREVDYSSQSWHTTSGEALAVFPLGGFSNQLALGHVIQDQLSNGRSESVQSTTLNGEPVLELSGTVEMYRVPASPAGSAGTDSNSGAAGNSGRAGTSGTPAAQDLPAAADSGTAGNSGSAPASPGTTPANSSAMAAASAVAAGKIALSGTQTRWTVWVDPTTYLPVQMMETAANGITAMSSIQWLAPSSADLGQLVAPIPPGFTEIATPADQMSPAGNSGS